jgi:trimethylamine:corrinoid methyltransferase-like protein
MLDFLACHSIEKLVIDAEGIASAQRLLAGVEPRGETLALSAFAQTGLRGDFLKLKETRSLFRKEQHIPSAVIDRRADGNADDILTRARARVGELVSGYKKPQLPAKIEEHLLNIATSEAKRVGLDRLPGIEVPTSCGV